jgi:FG-GAP repeat
MKKTYGFFTILSTMMILLITTSAGASFNDDGKGVYGNDPLVKASTTLSDRKALPECLTKTGWEKISASIERDRYRVHKDDHTGVYQAPNHTHGLNAAFTREGFEVSPQKGDKGWNWGLSLSRYGYGSDLRAVPAANKMITKDNRIEYHRGDMVEWYINDHRGLEQGFTLKTRPSGWTDSELLQLQMTTTTNLIPVVKKEGKGIIFRDARGKEVLRYSGLYAYDAVGKDLGARMSVDNKMIRLIVADHEAVYPITIDPFIETKKLLAGDGASDDEFGYSVSISGDTVIVGARGDGGGSGSAYIFSRDQGGADNWGEVIKLTASDGAVGDDFGVGVSISADTAIVGASFDDDNGNASGSAYIFSRDEGGADMWGEVQKLTAGDGATADIFGISVSIDGDTAIVGARLDDDNGDDSGSAYIFSRDEGGTNSWGQVQKLLAGDGASDDEFGRSVSISGDTAIVGAYYDDDNDSNSGSAYIFSRDYGGADNWGEFKKLITGDGAVGDWFGYSVSISGDTAIVGAYGDDNNGSQSGSAYIFSRDHGGIDNWGEVLELTPSDGAAYDGFGHSVSISGDTAIVGADGDDDNGSYSGSAYIFSRDQGGADNWGEIKKLTAGDGVTDDFFGYSVSISGDTAIVGAYGDDDNGDYSGSAYIFSCVFDELAVDFGSSGLYHYDDGAWAFLTGSNSDDLVAVGRDLYVDFGTSGLYKYDGSWTFLTGSNSEDMVIVDTDLYVDFGTSGLYKYDGTWTWLTGSNSEDMVAVGTDLYVDFGGSGLFKYDSTWTWLTGSNSEDMVAVGTDLYVDFGTSGLYKYDGAWTFLTGANAEDMVAVGTDLYVDFGASGLYKYDGTWTFLTGNSEDMVAVGTDLYVDFGTSGLYKYDGTWTFLTGSNSEDMVAVGTDLYVDFGASGLYKYDGTWTFLTGANSEDMVAVDLND